jgi:hypothetical protein
LLPYLQSMIGVSWGRWLAVWFAMLFLYGVWWIGAIMKVIESLDGARPPLLRRAIAMWCAVLAAFALVPHYPVFVGRDFRIGTANAWEFVLASLGHDREPAKGDGVDLAKAELAQPYLIDAMITQLPPERPGRTDIYVVGLAGFAQQDVFHKEMTSALAIIDRNLPIEGRAALLINNPKSLAEVPLANRQNFAAMVQAVARRMNKDEDVLFLFMTSHGPPDGVALSFPGSVNAMLSPQDVAAVLDREGIKNRIVVVSACYSGVLVKPLADDNTIVLTAADENSPSFGCSDDRDWTYFGEALFSHSLTPGKDLRTAFHDAKSLIGKWEAEQNLPASNPQAHFGDRLLGRLSSMHVARAAQLRDAVQQDAAGP